MIDKQEILDDLKQFGIDEIIAQFVSDGNAYDVIVEYIQSLESHNKELLLELNSLSKLQKKTSDNLVQCRGKLSDIKTILTS